MPGENVISKYQNRINAAGELELYGIIGDWWDDNDAESVARKLEAMDGDTITVRIQSDGGYITEGLAIYNRIKATGKKVNVVIDGFAASMASVIAMAGDHVSMPSNGFLMIHKPWSGLNGNADDMRKEANVLDQLEDSLLCIYTDKTGMAAEEIALMLEAETWINATDALAMGFIDEITGQQKAAARIDRKRFNKIPELARPWLVTSGDESVLVAENIATSKATAIVPEECRNMVDKVVKESASVADAKAEVAKAVQADRQRVADIDALGEKYGEMSFCNSFKAQNPDATADEFARELLARKPSGGSSPTKVALGERKTPKMNAAIIGLTDEEIENYSFANVAKALANPNERNAQEAVAFEREASHAACEKMGRTSQGILVPMDVLNRRFKNTADSSNNGALIATELQSQSFIEILRDDSFLMGAGVTELTGLVGDLDVARQKTKGNGYWVDEGVDVGEGAYETELVELTPNTVGSYFDITRKMQKQSTPAIESLIRSSLAKDIAGAIDRRAIERLLAETGVLTVDCATMGSPTHKEVIALETVVAAANAKGSKYALSSAMRGYFKSTEKFAGTSGLTIWEQGSTVNGYSTLVTNQMAVDALLFGNFADMLFAMWGGLDLTVDTSALSKSGGIRLVALQDVDFGVRHPESFAFLQQATPPEEGKRAKR
ncbi:ATP-dependent Clp endopeptidase proteolytic subunit ClpP/HK97 family phage major capsid protein,TIGR01554 [Sinobacterium caligoides]|uniref:ATP-dependent Clp protease proteolytic subunit n=1 Tax=Sinobacterium caligoides TaxID=933926 RepID=A0A3N2E2B1_9GAMM|nr:head maturation protease, ClpP-related [Sinobacterium caligoides]ROS05715.1 ATP-dependent Clp endopeptidase proteolytic subunit ClpP/HK97 family phage major capsid protein,TIGR01554 [Sinobacterium caligoides]